LRSNVACAAVPELRRSAASRSRFDGLRLGVFAPLRVDGAGFNAEARRRREDLARKRGNGQFPPRSGGELDGWFFE